MSLSPNSSLLVPASYIHRVPCFVQYTCVCAYTRHKPLAVENWYAIISPQLRHNVFFLGDTSPVSLTDFTAAPFDRSKYCKTRNVYTTLWSGQTRQYTIVACKTQWSMTTMLNKNLLRQSHAYKARTIARCIMLLIHDTRTEQRTYPVDFMTTTSKQQSSGNSL